MSSCGVAWIYDASESLINMIKSPESLTKAMPENTIHRGHGEELGWGWKLALATENLGQKSGVSCGLRGLKVSPHVLSHLGTAKLCATNTASAKVRLATTSNDWWVSKSCCSVYSERPTHKDANLESDPLAVVFFSTLLHSQITSILVGHKCLKPTPQYSWIPKNCQLFSQATISPIFVVILLTSTGLIGNQNWYPALL